MSAIRDKHSNALEICEIFGGRFGRSGSSIKEILSTEGAFELSPGQRPGRNFHCRKPCKGALSTVALRAPLQGFFI